MTWTGTTARCARLSFSVYLVDTNVLSAGAPGKTRPAPELADWMDRNSERLHLSVITVAEVADGIAKRGRADKRSAIRRRHVVAALATWFAPARQQQRHGGRQPRVHPGGAVTLRRRMALR